MFDDNAFDGSELEGHDDVLELAGRNVEVDEQEIDSVPNKKASDVGEDSDNSDTPSIDNHIKLFEVEGQFSPTLSASLFDLDGSLDTLVRGEKAENGDGGVIS